MIKNIRDLLVGPPHPSENETLRSIALRRRIVARYLSSSGSPRLNAEEVKALGHIANNGDRDGNYFSRETTEAVAEALEWDVKKTYRVLNGLARKGLLKKGGRVPLKRKGPGSGYQGPDVKRVGWQFWEIYFDQVPPEVLDQIDFRRM